MCVDCAWESISCCRCAKPFINGNAYIEIISDCLEYFTENNKELEELINVWKTDFNKLKSELQNKTNGEIFKASCFEY
jgi:hypothetical protein